MPLDLQEGPVCALQTADGFPGAQPPSGQAKLLATASACHPLPPHSGPDSLGAELVSLSCFLLLPSLLGLSPFAAPGPWEEDRALVDLSPQRQLHPVPLPLMPHLQPQEVQVHGLLGLAEALPLLPSPSPSPGAGRTAEVPEELEGRSPSQEEGASRRWLQPYGRGLLHFPGSQGGQC